MGSAKFIGEVDLFKRTEKLYDLHYNGNYKSLYQ